MKIGFIGLGLMGHAATKALVERGHTVTGYDILADKVEAARGHDVQAAASPAEVASKSDVVMVSVTSTDAVRAVVFGEAGVATSDGAGKVLIDLSTTEVPATQDMAERLKSASNMGWVDAPVSGGPEAAGTGSLAIMAGGSEADMRIAEPALNELAGVLTHMGPVGSGQVTKMVNQVLVLNSYVLLAEALALAEAGGVDAAKIPAALGTGHAGSNLLQAVFPRMAERDFEPRGYARQALKDLDMVKELARGLKTPTPMTGQAAELFRVLVTKGHGETDGTAILKMYDPSERL
ncbi:MAG: NAD(P)-dependent oxidoreductase [Alphaproteobacteria bacterium]|jgi:3-hydroxyisobutyrate dehydrogenase|nr:NAD(P)-dependent oxidoreductase [Alphaproteobacteria bacterium]